MSRKYLCKSGILALSLFAAAIEPAGFASFRCVVTALRHWLPTLDAAVELELSMSPEVLSLLTTADGTLAPIFEATGGRLAAPEWLRGLAAARGFSSLWAFPFDELSEARKMEILRKAAGHRLDGFFENRAIDGLVVRDSVKLRFEKETRFLGRQYAPGEHVIQVGNVFGRKVEFRSPQDVRDVSGVELHFRGGQTAGQMSNDAWIFLDGAGIPRSHQHVHFVAPLPLQKLKADPAAQALVMGDFFRRSNLAAEMVSIVHYRQPIARQVKDGVQLFGSLTPDQLYEVGYYFESVGQGIAEELGSQVKIAWVGMRGHDYYDAPNLWGMEFRAIGSNADPEVTRQLLEGLQASMNQEEYGLSLEAARGFLAERKTRNVGLVLTQTHYNETWPKLMANLPPELETAFPWLKKHQGLRAGWRNIEEKFAGHDEVRMLFFDWSNDPLFSKDARMLEGVRRRQVEAVRRLLRDEPVQPVMKEFLLQTGLYRKVLESVGLRANIAVP